jgi:hypothetical protein
MTEVVCRDSRGEIVVMNLEGKVTYRSSEVENYAGPLQMWFLDGNKIISKKFVDQGSSHE